MTSPHRNLDRRHSQNLYTRAREKHHLHPLLHKMRRAETRATKVIYNVATSLLLYEISQKDATINDLLL